MKNPIDSYEETYKILAEKLKGCDFKEAAPRLGFDFIDINIAELDFLGRRYEVTQSGVFPLDKNPSSPQIRGVIICYVTSKGSGILTGKYSFLHRFSEGIISSNGNMRWMTNTAVKAFKGDYKKFSKAAQKLGMVFEGSSKAYEHMWSYLILPKMPMRVIYYEQDEEFPCEIKLMFDNSASNLMEFEQLAFLSGCFIHALCEAST